MFDAADDEVAGYRGISSLAIAGLVAGLLAPLAMLSPALLIAPLVAVVLCGLALWQIATRRPDLAGRPLALAGLLLGTAFLVAAPVDDLVYRYVLRRQARQFAAGWIDAVRHGAKFKAHHLMIDPKHRLPLENDRLANYYQQSEKCRQSLQQFSDEPTMRTLFALGPAAEIRYYETDAQYGQDSFDVVRLIYAVTCPDEQKPPQPKTFFIGLLMQRSVDTNTGRAGWTLVHVDGGVHPRGW